MLRFVFRQFGQIIKSVFRVSTVMLIGTPCFCVTTLCQGPAYASVNVHANASDDPPVGVENPSFGGPITGTADVNYYVQGPEPAVTLSAASGQPSGVTYQWSVSGPLTVNGSSTGATVSISGKAPGSAPSGTVNLTYTLGTSTASAPAFSVQVHEPSQVKSVAGQGNPSNPLYADPDYGYGFQGEAVLWQLLDQVGRPMIGETVTENWNNEALNNSTIGLTAPLTAGQTTIAPPSPYFPFDIHSSWTTIPADKPTPGGEFSDQDTFSTLKWGFNARGVLVWNFTTGGSMSLFKAQHQFIDHGTVINHQTSWSTFHNDEPNNY